MRDQQIVDVVAAEMSVAVGRDDLEDAFVQLEDRNVEGAAAQIVNRNGRGLLLVQTIGQRRGCGLIHQAQHIEAGDAAGILRRLPLCVVEIRRNRDHRLLTGAEK